MMAQTALAVALLVSGQAAASSITLSSCTNASTQLFKIITVAPYVNGAGIGWTSPTVEAPLCFTIQDSAPGIGSNIDTEYCGLNAMAKRANQYWAINGDTLASLQVFTPYCFGFAKGSTSAALADCGSNQAQFTTTMSWRTAGPIVHKYSGMCVTISGTPPPLPPTPPPRPPDPPNTPCPPKTALENVSRGIVVQDNMRPCDIYAAAKTPCVAAHSVVRALYSSYAGPLYGVRRVSDGKMANVSLQSQGGFSNASAQDSFCGGTDCTIEIIYDQSPNGNHLRANHAGRHFPVDKGVNASAHPIRVQGQNVYGAWFDEGMGYRNDNTTGLAIGDESQSIYAVFGGHHFNDVCCFDYGNAENHIGADGPGTMEAIYFGNCTSWWKDHKDIPADWHGPYIMADLEAGMFGGNDTFNPQNSPIDAEFVSLMLKGQKCEMSLKSGNAQHGDLTTKYDGVRPTHADWNPMRKEGGLILGTGGDNSDRALGIFYEGALTRGFVTAAVDEAIQANIVATGYGN